MGSQKKLAHHRLADGRQGETPLRLAATVLVSKSSFFYKLHTGASTIFWWIWEDLDDGARYHLQGVRRCKKENDFARMFVHDRDPDNDDAWGLVRF